MASLIQWTWGWVNSRSWWWTGKPGMPQFTGLQTAGHDWVTEQQMISDSCSFKPLIGNNLWQQKKEININHNFNFLKKFFSSYLFWLCWVFVALQAFSNCGAWTSDFSGFCCCSLWNRGLKVVAHGLSCYMWDLPSPGTEPVSPALANRLFTTEPPGKP